MLQELQPPQLFPAMDEIISKVFLVFIPNMFKSEWTAQPIFLGGGGKKCKLNGATLTFPEMKYKTPYKCLRSD